MNKNELHSFPELNNAQMIHMFEDWIIYATKYYCQKNTIQPYEVEDLRQFIRIRLFEQLNKIKANYRGESKLVTYISAVILNLCREFRKKNCSKSILTQIEINKETKQQYTDINQAENNIAIENEIKSLNRIILMYGTKKAKVILALKMYYRQSITEKNILDYNKDQVSIVPKILTHIKRNEKLNKKEALKILTQLFNFVENKSNSEEATRKWISRLINEILSILNKGSSAHTKETLGLLLEAKQLK